ncbi:MULTISPECIES: carbohydrate ABC transporter permease [unclassified Streptomyces]|uniref:carbohydrate ABC transporter permease n=1 Tax=unclassified Streptomyces TaxID=2593676 RepID=UPI00225A6E32|nr:MULTISPECIES: carbohydrate ABC transporter permease [unclassified Streptomyces]WTB43470.1 carbohydrate ABC transporter permease [Streptomyces sp. NBC_00827]WUC08792.1 carbohydrate ABC transporter permease [Streptomyces sp. NBC_00564]WUC54779.1 carbohydrate ABC transporter permease [Streptomyces sp. NBC_00554]MCX4977151.1 carbohydrate ABC transporter permease [Streptomyces sp. NBC_00620]WRZ24905.1 carbohydrate ABC transporter permease [Streptomyces sp. NBC_00243]
MRTRPNYLAGAAALVWLVIIGVPLYALANTAVQPQTKYTDKGPVSIPSTVTWDNFRTVVDSGFLHYIWNTVVVAVATVAIVLALAVPISYAVVRGRGWISKGVFRLFLLGLAIPSQAVIIPLFLIVNDLGLYDTLWGIILPTAAFALPVSVLVLSGGMRDISNELYEAMALDGASPARTLVTLVIPMSRSAIATASVFAALQAWNGFLFPLIMAQSEDTKLVTLGLYNFVSEYGSNVPALLAAVLMSAVPILVVYLFARRALVAGLMGAGGK